MSWSRRFSADVLSLKKERVNHVLRAMRHRNYRIFFCGEIISLTGLWMQRVAMGWLVYRLTDSAFMLGAVEFAGQLPVFLFGIFTGVLLESMDLKRIIFICQVLSMLHAFILAVLTLSGYVEYWHILILSAVLGMVNAFEIPARQAFVVHLVEDGDDLGNAIALNSSLFNTARLLGPSIGGVAIAAFGEGICFIMNGFSYFATLLALILMKLRDCRRDSVENGSFLLNLREGFNYIKGFSPIRNTLLTLAVISFAGIPYLVLLPVFARNILEGGPDTLGFLTASSGFGALLGSVRLALAKTPTGMNRTMAFSVTFFGFFIGVFSFSHYVPLSMILMVFTGFFLVSSLVSCNTYIQSLVDHDKRSRVMSFYIFSILGIAPLGSLVCGSLASIIGAPATFVVGGAACMVSGIYLLRKTRNMSRVAEPVFRDKGYL